VDKRAIRLSQLSGRYLRTILSGSPIPHGQLVVLRYLREHRESPVTPTDLSLELGVRPPTVTPIIRRLERKEYLVRVPSDEDRRRVDLSITPEGLAALQELEAQLMLFYQSLLDRLTPDEGDELLRLMDKISDSPCHIRQKGSKL
jgi:DNA-binding MarR family transcriptional regulator